MNKEKKYWTNFVSVLGAGILGFGLGVYFYESFQKYAVWITLIGILMHGWAMYKNHKK